MIKAILTNYKNKILLALFSDGEIVELSFWGDDVKIGTVFLSRISKILPNIDACFVNYQRKSVGFLKKSNYKCETIIPLQFKKEASGSKEPLFSDDISISSDYCVIGRKNPGIKVSSKIETKKRNEIKDYFLKISEDLNISIIIRTNAESLSFDEIENDIRNLFDRLVKIECDSKTRTLYSVLYEPKPEFLRALLNLRRSELTEIITDDPKFYDQIADEPLLCKNVSVKLYEDDVISLFHLYRLEHHIMYATKRVIPLKSGGEIYIDVTEAMTVVDVNTHHSNKKEDCENTFLNTNIEAAAEIMKQIRLRNLSGMIVIDFINMKNNENYEILADFIKKAAKDDPIQTQLIDITGLKLFEIVRKKVKNNIFEQMR